MLAFKGQTNMSAAMILKQNRIKTELDGMFYPYGTADPIDYIDQTVCRNYS
mgnify:CR=1 FL=1